MFKKVFHWLLRKILYFTRTSSTCCNILLCEKSIPKCILLWTYLRLKCKEVVFVWLLHVPLKSEKAFGIKARIQTYSKFLVLIEEIFIDECYGFHARREDPLIIDCGSNIGMSIMYFKKRYPAARVIGFEAMKNIFSILQENMNSNRWEGVVLHNKAVSDKPGTLKFYYDQQELGTVVKGQEIGAESQVAQVEAVRLSDYIQEEVDFLKMDIEGAETLVFKELAEQQKLGFIREMVIEYHHHISAESDEMSVILSLLEHNGFGYQISTTATAWLTPETCQDFLIYAYRKEISQTRESGDKDGKEICFRA